MRPGTLRLSRAHRTRAAINQEKFCRYKYVELHLAVKPPKLLGDNNALMALSEVMTALPHNVVAINVHRDLNWLRLLVCAPVVWQPITTMFTSHGLSPKPVERLAKRAQWHAELWMLAVRHEHRGRFE